MSGETACRLGRERLFRGGRPGAAQGLGSIHTCLARPSLRSPVAVLSPLCRSFFYRSARRRTVLSFEHNSPSEVHMSGEQQLERSVLERKERDELQQIASAMGLTPGSRTSKANLVTQILKATGVDVSDNGGEDKPKRAPRKKAAETVDAADAPSSNGAAAENGSAGSLAAPAPASSSLAAPARAETTTEAPGGGDAAAGADAPAEQSKQDEAQPRQQQGQGQPLQNRDRQQNRDRDRGDRGERPERGNQQNPRQFDGGGNAEPGNRRNRRRRGRDRERGPGQGGRAAAASATFRAAARSSRSRASPSPSPACSTCATRATASCAPTATCRARRTSTSRSARCAASRCARATTSRAPAGPPAATRSTRPCCASTPSAA